MRRWLIEYLFPAIAALQARAELPLRTFGPDDWYSQLEKAPADAAAQFARQVYEDDAQRIRALEEKLSRHGGFVTFLVPLAIGTIALAADRSDVLAAGLAVLALIYNATAGFAVFKASSASERYLVMPHDLSAANERNLNGQIWIAAVRLACVVSNEPRSADLNNWIHVAQVSLFWGAALTGAGAFLAASPG